MRPGAGGGRGPATSNLRQRGRRADAHRTCAQVRYGATSVRVGVTGGRTHQNTRRNAHGLWTFSSTHNKEFFPRYFNCFYLIQPRPGYGLLSCPGIETPTATVRTPPRLWRRRESSPPSQKSHVGKSYNVKLKNLAQKVGFPRDLSVTSPRLATSKLRLARSVPDGQPNSIRLRVTRPSRGFSSCPFACRQVSSPRPSPLCDLLIETVLQ